MVKVECTFTPGYRTPWWNDVSFTIASSSQSLGTRGLWLVKETSTPASFVPCQPSILEWLLRRLFAPLHSRQDDSCCRQRHQSCQMLSCEAMLD